MNVSVKMTKLELIETKDDEKTKTVSKYGANYLRDKGTLILSIKYEIYS